MKAIRIVQVVALVLLAVYVAIFHAANPETVRLPGLLSLPIAFVMALAMVLAWLVGWLPAKARVWRLERKLSTVRGERDRLLEQLEPSRRPEGSAAVIPDRADPRQAVGGGDRRGDDPSDYL
ncbi:MAG: LapA family protein [Trueperaceae bacterium]|nr:MAG: LapA family protein [Trueperaceae bacterium]